jgi:hypothetical protein
MKRRKLIGDTFVDAGGWPHFLQGPFIGRGRRGGLYGDESESPAATDARKERSSRGQQREIFCCEVGRELRKKHPHKSARWIAPRAHGKVNELLLARRLKRIRESTVYSYLRKNWALLAPPK